MICNIPNVSIERITADPKFKEILKNGGVAAEGVETAFQKYADLLKKGLIEPGKEKDAAVKAFADSYQWLSDRANTWLNDLPANGPKAEAYKNSVAQSYVEQAQKLQNTAISADAKLAQLTTDVNKRIESVAGKGVSNYLGRAFDAAQIATAFAEGDMAGVYENLAQMVGAELGGIAGGAIAVGAFVAVGATAPAWIIAVAAGAGAAAAAYFGESLYQDIGKFVAPHAEAFGRWVAAAAANLFDCEVGNIKKKTQTASTMRSPIILDLDGDGVIGTVGLSSGVFFDHAGDGFAERTGWVAPGDGLLVWDRNANGLIGSGGELFGSETLLPNGLNAVNGFEALKAFDANGDGFIDANDPVYAQLRVWVDADTNARTGEGELRTLQEAGVKSISVTYANSTLVDAQGNAHRQVGSYTTTDGQTRAATDVWVQTDPTFSLPTESVDVPEDIVALPTVQGYGKVRELHQAMAMDATGELKALVTAFTQATTPEDRDTLVTQIIYRWTGVQDVDPTSRAATMIYGNAIGDARKLEALEEFMGEEWAGVWCWGTRDPNPHGRAAPVLLQAWDELKALVYGQLMSQSQQRSLFQSISYQWDAETESVVGDLSAVAQALATQIANDRESGLDDLGDFLHSLKGMGLLNQLDVASFKAVLQPLGADVAQTIGAALNGWTPANGPSEGNDVLRGTELNDLLDAQGGNDRLLGRGGNDTLIGGAGNDVLDGGVGNDELRGGSGSDTYRFGRGDENDTINEDSWQRGETDRIEFKAGVLPSDVRMEQVRTVNGWQISEDLKITILDTGETLTVKNHFNESNRHAVEEIIFADGTLWNSDAIQSQVLIGDATNEELRGFNNRNDTILGGAGNDRLQGLSGDDVLGGGAGNDSLEGGVGADTYRFGLGGGQDLISEGDDTAQDVLELAAGVTPDDVSVRWTTQGDMAVTLADGSRVTVRGQANPWTNGVGIEQVRFADGTTWDRATLATRALSSSTGDDAIVGSYQDDTLEGGTGNDHFQNLGGYDTYHFGVGDGQDVIEAAYGRVLFKPGIGQNDVVFTRDGVDLVVTLNASGDAVRVKNWLGNWQRIDRFEFSNAAQLSVNDVLALVSVGEGSEILYGSPGDDALSGSEKDSTLYGREGNDTLSGGAGADQIYGEDSNDTLYGDQGSDTLHGGAGHDTLDGGAGRDWLYGNLGNNTYAFARGMGLDHAVGASLAQANDTVVFAPGIRPQDVTVQLGDSSIWSGQQVGDAGYSNLVIGIGGNDALVLRTENGDDLGRGAIQHFRFDDGTQWSLAELVARADGGKMGSQQRNAGDASTLLGSQADDYISDYTGESVTVQARGNDDTVQLAAGNDMVSAGSGDDAVNSGQGDDLIAGEAGDDRIDTGAGDDVLVFNYGDGRDELTAGEGLDMVSFGTSVMPGMLSVALDRNGRVMLLVDGGAGGTITLSDTRVDNLPGGLERVQFIDADGKTRVFDLAGWLRANGTALLGATVDSRLTIDSTFERTGTAAPAGGLAAVAYAQTGDLFAQAHLTQNTPTAGNDVLYGTPNSDTLDAGAGNDIALGLAGDDTIFGGEGNDLILGGDGDDVLQGGTGDDVLRGGWGRDQLSGGTGRDQLFGEWGGDSYTYQSGHGEVVIDDDHRVLNWGGGEAAYAYFEGSGYGGEGGYGGIIVDDAPNVLNFGSGIRAQDLRYSEHNGDLVIEFANQPGDRLILRGYESGRATQTRSVDIIRFADGTEIVAASIEPTGNTVIAGDEGAWLDGSAAADTLIGGDSDDVLDGQGGADRLAGGTGSDTYRIYKQSGSRPTETLIAETWRAQDRNRIELTGDINADDLRLEFDGRDLLLRLSADGDAIRFAGFDPRAPGMQAPVSEISLSWQGLNLSFDELMARGVRYGDDIQNIYDINIGDGEVFVADVATPDAGNVLRFGTGIDPNALRNTLRFEADGRGGHVLVIAYGGAGDVVRLTGFDPEDVLGVHAVDRFEFADGTALDYATLVSWGFVVQGDNGGNALRGSNAGDRLHGYDGDDLLNPGAGSDELHGAKGRDVLYGGAGDDAYVFNKGDGVDTIVDSGATDFNYIRFGAGIRSEDIRKEWDGTTLVVHYTNEDAVRIENYRSSDGNPVILALAFEDGTVVSLTEQLNRAPVVNRQVNDAVATEDQDFSLTLPADLFTDPDALDEVHLTVRQANGDPLPAWLQFDAVTRTLSGRPTNDQVGGIELVVQGKDQFGLGASTSFQITVANTNDAPVVAAALTTQAATEDAVWSYTIPAGTFTDVDAGDVLTYSAKLTNRNALPSWLSFNAATRTFSGTPLNGDVGSLSLSVTATDSAGASASSNFNVTVANTNDAPIVVAALTSQAAAGNSAWSYTIPAGTFTDVDANDVLTYAAKLANGNALPNWLSFNAATRTFSGTPANSGVGNLNLMVTATDTAGATASSSFNLTVANTNTPPTVINKIATQTAREKRSFSFTVPLTTFAGANVGDTLTYSALAVNDEGSTQALPSWLSFNAATRTFSGTAGSTAGGSFDFQVTATDRSGASVSTRFTANIFDEFAGTGANLNIITGSYVNDTLNGTSLSEVINGNGGNDTVSGGAGDDILSGGTGIDLVQGGAGNDTLLLSNDGTWSGNFVCFNAGSPGKPGSGKTVSIRGAVKSFDAFDGGQGYDTLQGTAGNDVIVLDDAYSASPNGYTGRFSSIERINAGAGNDVVDLTSNRFGVGDITLNGGQGDDTLWSSAGNDTLVGGAGNDALDGGAGNDTYLLGRGDGADTISEHDATPGNTDVAVFGSGIATSQLWLRKTGNNLDVSIIGTTDKFTVSNWYLGNQYHVEQFKTSDGKTLLDSQVQNLVQAMASFAPPPMGQTSLTTAQQTALAPVIAANWQ